MFNISSLPVLQESPSSFMPEELVNIVGEFIQPESDQDSPSLYENYQYDLMRIHLYKTLYGKVPHALKTFSEWNTKDVRLRTEYLEDWAVVHCFMAYCKRHPFSEASEEEIRCRTLLCLRGNKTLLCPFSARVKRFIDLYSSVQHPWFWEQHAVAEEFLACPASDRLAPLINSVVEIAFDRLTSYHDTRSAEPVGVIKRSFPQLIKALVIHSISYVLIMGCMLIQTALKIVIFMASMILICAVLGPIVIVIVSSQQQGRGFGNSTEDMNLWVSMGMGAVVGFGIGIQKTLPYIKKLWKTRHLTVQLHKESFRAFKRLWVDYTRTFGYATGSWQLVTALLKSHKTPHPSVVRQT